MDQTNENKNPFLPDLLRSVGATVILFALFSFMSRYSFASQRFYRVILVAFMGACSVALSKSLFSYFRFAAFARRRAPRRADLESYLDDRRTRELSENEPLQFGVSLVLVSVLLILLTMSGKATAHLFGGISAGELAGRYELTEVIGTDETAATHRMMKELGFRQTLEIDQSGNGIFRVNSLEYAVCRFDARKMILLKLEDGEETGRGTTFTWQIGTLTVDNTLVFQKTEDGK